MCYTPWILIEKRPLNLKLKKNVSKTAFVIKINKHKKHYNYIQNLVLKEKLQQLSQRHS